MTVRTRPCEICGEEIPAERLECLPETRLCVEHSKLIERYGGEFTITIVHTNLAKSGSIKRNYGDVTSQKIRNHAALQRLRQEYEMRGKGQTREKHLTE
jgi:hypothetical protein